MGLIDKRKIAALPKVLKQSITASADRIKLPFVKSKSAEGEAFLVGMSSVIGKREYQQDVISCSDNRVRYTFDKKWMAVLCDGMGGMNGGEKASSLCARRMLADFNQNIDDVPAFFKEKIVEIDREISQLTDKKGKALGAGSTLVSIIIDNGNLYWGSVGDSHIYIMRSKEFVQVNNDHNYLAVLLERARYGEITVEQAYKDRQREALISYMGIGNISVMDVSEKPFRLKKDDVIILCSDGLYRSLTEDEMHNIILENIDDMTAAANSLTAAATAKKYANQDNTSVIAVRYQ